MTPPETPDPYRTIAQMAAGQRFLERYTLTRILGRGGFGVVWLARDDELDMDVAIKFLSDLIVNNPEAIDDLKRETRYSLRLTHPNIVRIHGFLQGPNAAGVSMEYVDGGTLSALKVERPNRCFDVEVLAPLVEKLCDALYYAHSRVKVAHRDLKPGNLMVDSTGDLKVADFGISRSISDTQTALTQVATSGTPAYMSPQQMMGEHSQVTDDIYSLGATLYDLLAGKPPFYQGNVIEQVRSAHPVSIESRRADLGIQAASVPALWNEVILACLEKQPEARPQTAAEVAARLGLHVNTHLREGNVLGGSGTSGDGGIATPTSLGTPPDNRLATPVGGTVGQDPARPETAPAKTSGARRLAVPTVVAVLVLAGAFAGWRLFGGKAESPPEVAVADQGAVPARDGVGAAPVPAELPSTVAPDLSVGQPQDVEAGTQPGTDAQVSANEDGPTRPLSGAPEVTAPVGAPAATPGVPSGPSASELARNVESALAAEHWDAAEEALGRLRSVAPEDSRLGSLFRRIDEGRRASDLRARIPGLIEREELAEAESALQLLGPLRPGDGQVARWQEQIDRRQQERASGQGEHAAVWALVTEFHSAFSELDLDRFASLFVDPSRTREEFGRAFRDLESQSISVIGEPVIELLGGSATVRLRDHRRQVMKMGRTFESDFDVVLLAEKHGGTWKIREAQTKLRQG